MLWNAKNGAVSVGGDTMSFVSFGRGDRAFVILPGLSDGLATVKNKALLLAMPYRLFFRRFTVYMFSRKDRMPAGYTIRDMAGDQAEAMRLLGIGRACVMGVSQGGMIAQYLAADHPDLVDRLVLAVTAPRADDTIRGNVERWIGFAERGDHRSLMIDTAEKSYSPEYLKKYRRTYPIIGHIGKPADYGRFLVNARAILGFDAYEAIGSIACPTLIIGGEEDKVVGIRPSHDMKERIPGSEIAVYPGLGHAAYEEAEDFNRRVYDFLTKDTGSQTI